MAGQVESALGFEYRGSIRVELAATDAEFRRLVPSAPDWAAAVAKPRQSMLAVRLSVTGPETGQDVASVLRHELVHLMLPERLGGFDRVPLWFEEGLAQVLGAPILGTGLAHLKVAEAAGRLPSLASLTVRFPPERSKAALAYSQSESVVRYLIERHGLDELLELLDRTRRTGSFEEALSATYGLTPGELASEWRKWLRGTGRPWWLEMILSRFVPFLLFAASLLVIIGFLRARRRQRDTYESLPE
jgi:hypothetical protein